MKSLLILFAAVLFLFGCNEKKQKVEVVPNLDEIYLPADDLDTPPEESEEMNKKMDKDLVDAVQSLYDKNSNKPMWFRIALRIYLNENGSVDKIKDIFNPADMAKYANDTIPRFSNRQKMYEKIADAMVNWKLSPGKNDGQNVKTRGDLKVNILMKPDGTHSVEMPDLEMLGEGLNKLGKSLSEIFMNKKDYLISVDEMPSIVGGLKALVDKIKYPKEAKDAGIEGKVFIKAYIDENGNVVGTEILKSVDSELDKAAVEAVKSIEFTPGKLKGKPVKVQVVIPIVFKLH